MAARITAGKKRAYLRQLAREADANAVPLRDMLYSFQEQCLSTVRTGQIVVSTSGGGFSTALKIPGSISQLNEEELLDLSEDLIQTYETALATLAASNPAVTSPTDAQMLSTMLDSDNLATVRQMQHDITLIRYPGYGPALR